MNEVTFEPERHKYFDAQGREVPSVSAILKYYGYSQIENLIAIHGQEHFDHLAQFGKEVHTVTAADDLGCLESLEYDNQIDPWLGAWRTFREEHPMEFIAVEQPLMSTVWGFAGTPDRISARDLPDIKTGAATIAERLQTALYAILAEENFGVKIKSRYAVHLQPWKYKIEKHDNPQEVSVVRGLLLDLQYKRKMRVPICMA